MKIKALPNNSIRSNKAASRFEAIFNPKSVAVIGASATFGKWGQMILSNIVAADFQGSIFPVNSKEKSIYGLAAYQQIGDIPEIVDLAFISTPAETVSAILEECGEKGVKGVVIITSGFSETDAAGKRLEKDIVSICQSRGITLIGPNTMGIICPHANLFATGTHTRPQKGSVAFVSQSGNLGNQLTHWMAHQGIGISIFVGSGNEAMVTYTDYLEYLEHDPHTSIIVLYVESVADGGRFIAAAKRINRKKPIILLKGGRTEAGQSAVMSHTGSMSGEFSIFSAACAQAGISNATMPSELLDLSAGFSSLPLPMGNRVGIVTLGGGWGVVTADKCNEKGLVVPDIPDSVIKKIGTHLPPFWSHGNPVDLVGSRDFDTPIVAVEELLKWEGIDAVISLGTVGRYEFIGLLTQSLRKKDFSFSPEILGRIETSYQEYEEEYIARIVELMEIYEKPVIGVSLANTDEGTVRFVDGRRYCGVFYQTLESAVNVLSKMEAYRRFIEKE